MSTDQKTSYLDVKNSILKRIHDTVWEPGSLMPGEVALSEEFGCARATVSRDSALRRNTRARRVRLRDTAVRSR